MRRILTVLGAVLLVFIAVPASPAGALQQTGIECTNKSGGVINPYNVTVCVDYGWRVQNDGTGVHMENVRVWVGHGCGDLEATALSSVIVTLQNGGGRVIGNQAGCDVTWNLEDNGPDTGAATVQTTADVNVDGNPDFDVNVTCEIHPQSGNSDCSASHN